MRRLLKVKRQNQKKIKGTTKREYKNKCNRLWKLFAFVNGDKSKLEDKLASVEEVVKEQLIEGLSGLEPQYILEEEK